MRGYALANAARTRRDDPEHRVHVRAVAELRASFVRRGISEPFPLAHLPAETSGPVQWHAKRVALGCPKGFPDLVIVHPILGARDKQTHCGAALELKAPGGRASPDQRAWLQHFADAGFFAKIVLGHRDCAETLAMIGLIERAAADAWIAWAGRSDPGAL